MFAKSKRFPEGNDKMMDASCITKLVLFPPPVYFSAGKDYIPGPGEYQVSVEDSAKHKRYGFLTQTNRFSEGHHDPFIANDFYAINNESTTTSISISSTTSSNRTSDESAPRSSPPRKSPISPIETMNPFEKYRYAMQKEIETLQTKTRKMDSTIQTLEAEKNETKALLLDRDLELADLRSKNAMLQKTAKHAKQLREKEDMRLEIDTHKQSVCDLQEAQESSQQVRTLLEAQIHSLTAQLAESESNATQQDMQITELKHKAICMTQSISSLEQQIEAQSTESASLKQVNDDLLTRLRGQQDKTQELESRLALKDEEIGERDRTLQEHESTIRHIDQRFNVYRKYMDTTVLPHLRDQAKSIEQKHIKELNELLTELHEAKRFMNKQAQSMDWLKSSTYWLNVHNTQLKTIIHCMFQEHKKQWATNKKYYKKHTQRQHDDAISFSSNSALSSNQETLSSNCMYYA
ncbi:hypothetical protein [Parasitella parasitica]|uniref:Uncharacterized protein n=1 Tax=Parasitella parasitica TaxID=35722 RepID=A0A0B7NIC9_9FUNG|nr:hypothetical protein [Parasitella parasitica]